MQPSSSMHAYSTSKSTPWLSTDSTPFPFTEALLNTCKTAPKNLQIQVLWTRCHKIIQDDEGSMAEFLHFDKAQAVATHGCFEHQSWLLCKASEQG